jgi:hypothetical protein
MKMAILINGLTNLQDNLLRKKFGYIYSFGTSCPEGHTGEALEWLRKNHRDCVQNWNGPIRGSSSSVTVKVYFTNKMIKELES